MTSDDEGATVASENIFLSQQTLSKLMQDSSTWPVTQMTPDFSVEEAQRRQGKRPSSFYLSPGMYETEAIENTVSCLIAGPTLDDNAPATAVSGDGKRIFVKRSGQSDMPIFQKPIKINSCASLVIHGVWFTNRVEVVGKGPVYFSQCVFGATAWSSDVLASSPSFTSKFASVRVAVDGECCFYQCDFDNICGMAGTVGVNEVPVITACGCTKLNICNSSFCGPGVVSTALVLLDSSRLEADSIYVVRCCGHGLIVRDKSCAVIFRSVFGYNGNGVWIRDRGNLEIRDSSIEAVYNGRCSLFLSGYGRCFAQYCSFSALAAHPYSIGTAIVAARNHAHVSLSVCELFWEDATTSHGRQQPKGPEELRHHNTSSAIACANDENGEDFGFCHVLLRGSSEATLTRCIIRMPNAGEPKAEFAAVGVFLQSVSQITSFPLYAVENTIVYECSRGSSAGTQTEQKSNWKDAAPLMFGLVLPCILDDEVKKNLQQLSNMWMLTNQFIESNEQPFKDASLICCSYDTYCELTGKSPFASFDSTGESVDAVSDSFSTTAEVLEKNNFSGNSKNNSNNNNNIDGAMKDASGERSRHDTTNTPQEKNMGFTHLPLNSVPEKTFESGFQGAPTAVGCFDLVKETNKTFFMIQKECGSSSTSLTSFSEEEEEEESYIGASNVVKENADVVFKTIKASKHSCTSSSSTEPFLQRSGLHEETAPDYVSFVAAQSKVEQKKVITEQSNASYEANLRSDTQVSLESTNESASPLISLGTDEKGNLVQSPLKRKTQYPSSSTVDMRSVKCRRGVRKKVFAECRAKAVTPSNSRTGTPVVTCHNGNNVARPQTGNVRPVTAKINSRFICNFSMQNDKAEWSLTSTNCNRDQFVAQSRETKFDQLKEVLPLEVSASHGLPSINSGLHSTFEAHNQVLFVPTGKEENGAGEQPYRRRVPPTRVDVEPLIAGIRERCICSPKHATRLQPPWTAPPNYFSPRVCHSIRERVRLAPLRLYKDFWEKWHKTHLFSELLSELRNDQRQRERLTVDEMKSQANRMHTMGLKERGSGVEGGGVAGSARNYALQRRIVRPCMGSKSVNETKEQEADATFSQTCFDLNITEGRKTRETIARRGFSNGGQRLQVPRPTPPSRATDERPKTTHKGRRVHPDHSTI